MRKILLFALLCVVSTLGMRAQDFPVLLEKADFGGTVVSSLATFRPTGTTYTLEVTGTAGTEITVPGGSFSYTPTTSGTVRFVRNGGNVVYVYEGSSYKGTVDVSAPEDPTYPDIFGDTDNSSDKTGIYSESNLFLNPGFETKGDKLSDHNYKAVDWECNGYDYGSKSRVRDNTSFTGQEGSCTFFIHGYGNPAECLSQTLTGLNNFTPYKFQLRSWKHETNNAKFGVTIGTSASDGSVYSGEITLPNDNSTKDQVLTFTTGAITESSYVFALTRKTSNGMGDFDRMSLVAANGGGIGITGATNVKYLAGSAYAPEGVLAANETLDVTSLITNAAVTSTSGWTNGRINSNQQYTGAPDNTYMDTWDATLDQKQTIKLPAGYYLLQAATRASGGISGGNIYAYVSADDVTFRTDINKEGAEGNLLGGGWAWTRVPVVVTQNSDVVIGFWSNCSNYNWAGADNFTLTYYNSELNMEAARFERVRENADAWVTILGESIKTGIINTLTAEDGNSYGAVEDYQAATARLEAAIAFARTKAPALYEKYATIKALVQALPTQTEVYTGSATIDVDVDATDALLAAAVTEEEFNEAILVWRNAAAAFLGAIKVNTDQYFDITNIFLDNADFSAGNILGWETNYVSGQQAQNIGYQGASYTNEDVTISQFIEAWKPAPGTLGDGYLRQTVKNLPEGKYTLEADAISVQQQDENAVVAGSYLYIYADGVDYKTALDTKNNKPQHFSREFLNTGEGDVVFGLKTESSTGNWLCADNFTVKFYGVDLSAYVTQLAEAVEEAVTVTGIPEGAASVLAEVVEAYNKEYNTSQAYASAISAIQEATTTALSYQTPLANYIEAMGTAEAFTEDSMWPAAWTALQTAISNNTVDLTSTSITVDDLETATTNLDAANVAANASVNAKNTYETAVATIDGGTNVDLTSLIVNPGFEEGNTNGWTNSGTITANAQGNKAFDNTQGNYYAERWHADGTVDINQTIQYLPAGIYKIEAYIYSDTGDAKLYANSEEVSVSTSRKYSAVIEITEKGSIKIGATCTLTNSTWICIDDFKLTYLASSYAALPYTLAEGKFGTDLDDAQKGAETTFMNNPTLETYNALLTAINNAEAGKANYDKLKAAIDKAEAVKDANNFVTADATTALEVEISTATAAWTNVTYTDAQATAEIAVLGSSVSGWHGIGIEGKAGVYMTSAWGKTSENWWDAPYINTWSVEGDDDGTGFSVPFFEYFIGDSDNLPANTFTATLTGLDNGAYEVEIWARVQRRTDADFNADNSMITMSVNGGEAVSIMSGQTTVGTGGSTMRLGRYKAYGQVTDGTLTLSIDVKLGSNVHWLSWRDVKYEKVASANMKITDAEWGTFVAPFDVAIPSGVAAFTVENNAIGSDDVLNLTTVATTIPANTPVIVFSESLVDETFYGKTVDGDPTHGLLTGTYTDIEAPNESYVLQKHGYDVGFYQVDTNIDTPMVRANRAYLVDPRAQEVKAFFFGGDATGVKGLLNTLNTVDAEIFNAAGVRQNGLQKGINIVRMKDGSVKKVMVK